MLFQKHLLLQITENVQSFFVDISSKSLPVIWAILCVSMVLFLWYDWKPKKK